MSENVRCFFIVIHCGISCDNCMCTSYNKLPLCEQGIRTYERVTCNTLNISAVSILKKETHLPIVVDVTHSTGQRDLLPPAAKAAMAIGADAAQQMNISQFNDFMNELKVFGSKL